jgi:hypothetical protein
MRFRRREAGKTSAVPPIEDVPFFTNRPDPDPDPLPTPYHPTGNNFDQLQKAERILGITHPLSQPHPPHQNALRSLITPNNARQRPPPSAVSAPEPTGNHLWSQSADQEYHPMSGTAPSANGGLKAWPSLQTQNLNPSAHALRTPQDVSHRNNLASKTSHPTLHSHFEAAQQNTSSGTRDMGMGLRKVRSGVPSSKSGVESNGRPLKSAMRRPSNDPEPTTKPASKKEGGMRMPKFANFLPRHNSSNRSLLQPSQLSQYGSSLSVASASPSNANSRSPSFSHGDATASGSVTSDPTMRPKVFETDVYDASKLNVRRPPKGIQNWFDGIDISSDDDDKQAAEALPSTFSPYEDYSRQPTGKSSTRGSDRQNSSAGHNAPSDTESRRSGRQPNRPAYTQRDISDTFVEENAIAIDLARQRMKSNKKTSQSQPTSRSRRDSYAPSLFSHAQSIMSGAYDGMSDYNSMMKRDRDSRLAHSRRGDESVLSLTDNSDDDRRPRHPRESVGADSRYTADLGEASPVSVRRPSTAPRPYMSKRSNTRDSNITTQTSGSIPIHWSNESPIPAMPRRATGDSMVDHTSEALRRLIGRENSQRTRQSRASSSRYESEGSATGETIDSMPSDISRMMAVTEEEMALLEMMRLKRAAMQQGNISEGAQNLLKREEEQIMIKQKAAQKVAQKLLLRNRESRANSRSEEWAQDLRPDYERIAGLGSHPDQDVADKLRIDRFLAYDAPSPIEGAYPFPDPPSRSREGSIPSDNAAAEGLLLPRTYTPQPGTAKSHNKSVSPAPPAPSTASSADEFDADESAQLEADMRQFLGGGEFAESSAFPMPPKPSSRRSSRRVTRTNAHLAPVLPSTREEDTTTPPIPTRSPNRTPYSNEESVLPPSDRTTQTHVRADSEALHFFPPTLATRPNSRRQPEVPTPGYPTERISEFLGEANFDCGDLAFPTSAGTSASLTSTMRFDSPSIGTSQPSPLTPTFPLSLASAERGRVQIANHDAAYHHQHHAYDGADQNSVHTSNSTKSTSKSQSQLRPQSRSQPPSRSQARRTSKLAQLDTLQPATYNGVSLKRTTSHVSSPSSDISASDDVLAAWAELGGVSDGLSMARARSPMQVR